MKNRALVAALAALVVIAALYVSNPTRPADTGIQSSDPSVLVGGARVAVTLAITKAQRERGLSGTDDLGENEGMLFVFPEDGQYRFWMKDMNYPIDIIWIDSDGRIVYIAPSVSPETYPNSYGPDAPARYVLEVRSGFAAAHNVKVGDRIDI